MTTFICPEASCGRKFTRRNNLNRHYQTFHLNNDLVEKCFLCGQIFQNCTLLQKHYRFSHRPSRHFYIYKSAFRKNVIIYRYNFNDNEINFAASQLGIEHLIKEVILLEAAKKTICKISLVFSAEMEMLDHIGDRMTIAQIPFRASNFLANASMPNAISKNIRASFQQQQTVMEDFQKSGSNWQFSRSLVFDIEVGALSAIVAGSNSDKNTPPNEAPLNIKTFKNKQFLYNPSNKNQKCFLYCLAFALYNHKLVKNSKKTEEQQLKKYFKNFITEKIDFPISIQGIKKFLKINTHLNIKLNILFRDKQGMIYPYVYGLGDGKQIVNLLMVCRESEDKGINHFLVIKDINKYLRSVYRGQENKKSYRHKHFCLHCLNSFSTDKILQDHQKLCSLNKPRLELAPEEGKNLIRFKNYEKTHPVEYTAYLDFEAVLPSKGDFCKTCESLKCRCDSSFTHIVNEQDAMGYSFLIVNQNKKVIHEHSFIGDRPAENFVTHLLNEEKRWIKDLLKHSEDMIMTKDDYIKHEQSTNCYICNIPFSNDIVKCRDHSHVTSKFLGSACNSCNMRRRKQSTLKIFCHNASRYDLHFIISCLGEFGDEIKNLRVLPFNGENFRTIAFNSFEFLDTLAFLQSSLAKLTSDYKNTNPSYSILKQTYLVKTDGKFDQEKFDMVLEKSYYPYEYCTSIKQMEKTTKMPKKKYFYSSLTETTISDEEYLFAKSVWKKFKCKNLLDYCRIYVKIDVVLLAEVFEQFRKDMHNFSGLDPAHYISLPGYSYDSMLKLTGCEITLPTDITMIQFLEKAKRGGMSFIGTRHFKPKKCSNLSSEAAEEIVYIDANVSFI